MAKSAGVDLVIGLGGGSSMDTAKAIAVEATHPGTAWDYNCHTEGPTSATLPIIAIGTTAGTEVNVLNVRLSPKQVIRINLQFGTETFFQRLR